jgi:type IV/VI secretion system ImpK/VasF family protein
MTLDTTILQPLFNEQKSVNKIMPSAASLIHLALLLKTKFEPADIFEFHQKLVQEIQTFREKMQFFDYSEQVVGDATYVLCAFLDEMMAQTKWGKEYTSGEYSLLAFFDLDTPAAKGKQVFTILKSACENPTVSANLDVLELIYISFILGYEGKYRGQQKGKAALGKITHDLYDCILKYRSNFDYFRLQEEIKESNKAPAISYETKSFNLLYLWITLSIGIFVIVLFYIYFNSSLNDTLGQVFKEIAGIPNFVGK